MLKPEFFERSAVEVAKNLLGCLLCVRKNGKVHKSKIIETEAYEGPNDLASHASRGRTPRNEVMFGKPGIWYVYFIYGMYNMLNIVCGKEGHPAAVLIRGVTGFKGPGRLTKSLGIDRGFNGLESCRKIGLWIEAGNWPKIHGREKMDNRKIKKLPRAGVDYAGQVWSKKLYRFVLEG
ncbi:MAG: DNA-3-methyladenine glycosylase [Candidatus Zambryskibacteria bacterium]|nr:DNA-3-methyladenine glycosylase [Candidatus Zambryskibacteria bacterium]